MSIFHGFRYWWQRRTGVDDSPFDGDTSAFAVSFVVHMLLLIILGLFPVVVPPEPAVILVSAALVLPGATARLVSRSFGSMMTWAVVFGTFAIGLGLLLANFVNVPAGAAVVIVQSAVFGAVWLGHR